MIPERAGGTKTLILSSEGISMEIAPEIGGKILSLTDRANGEEWMWAPTVDRVLFKNRLGDSFAKSTLVGADECFPTVGPCHWQGRDLPDHGELWAVPWQVLRHSAVELEMEVRAPISPFVFKRKISLNRDAATFSYVAQNVGESREAFVWAFHPLLRFDQGDSIEVPAHSARVDSQINTPFGPRGAPIHLPEPIPGVRLDQLHFGPLGPAAVKYFTDSLSTGRVALNRLALKRRLVFSFELSALHTVGVWINDGGWSGYRHIAIEPTNGAPDPLDTAVEWNRCHWLEVGAQQSWAMTLRFEDLP